MASKSVYDDESDSERGFMLRPGSRSESGPGEKVWSWQCQAIAYAALVLLMALNLMSGGDGPRPGPNGGGPTLQRKIVAIGGGQAADKPWISDTIIGMTGKTTPTVSPWLPAGLSPST